MNLVIAEKPSVAQSLAAVIGATVRKDGYQPRIILACRIIINDLLGKLYRYDYRFGYNLLLDEENSIEKKLHTPVREEWEAEDYEFSDC